MEGMSPFARLQPIRLSCRLSSRAVAMQRLSIRVIQRNRTGLVDTVAISLLRHRERPLASHSSSEGNGCSIVRLTRYHSNKEFMNYRHGRPFTVGC